MKLVASDQYLFSGQCQGIGLRPSLARIAIENKVRGFVKNSRHGVELLVQGSPEQRQQFAQRLQTLMQSQPQLQLHQQTVTECPKEKSFRIIDSDDNAFGTPQLTSDLAICDQCLSELFNPQNRRYRYPFIACPSCGPRYSIVQQLPLDRVNTSMSPFAACPQCLDEYHNPTDRRFHFQGICCADCGPTLSFAENQNPNLITTSALHTAVELLRADGILGLKGLGGYQLLCAARSAHAIETLRQRKNRPHKPFAIMLPETQHDQFIESSAAQSLMRSSIAPIMLQPRSDLCTLPMALAPGLHTLGVMRPATGLHALLLEQFGEALVVTSGNVSGEPIFIDDQQAQQKLRSIADGFLQHDRQIIQRVDDAVYQLIDDQPAILRYGRGNSPNYLTLPFTVDSPTLALGGHLKNSFALAWGNQCVISPHNGDLDSVASLDALQQTITQLTQLHQLEIGRVIVDAHPRYGYQHLGLQDRYPTQAVWHHQAHASALAGEFPVESHWLIFTWDGIGLGEDGSLWGGETLCGAPGNWQRHASLRPFKLPGGEACSREPWRSARSLLWETGMVVEESHPELALLQQAWRQGINAPWCHSMGRLFDAAAALLGLCGQSSYEGQAAMMLEAICCDSEEFIALSMQKENLNLIDWQPLLPMLLDESLMRCQRAAMFHNSLMEMLVAQALNYREQHGDVAIGFSGGVFQNRRLSDAAIKRLRQHGFRVYYPRKLPINDAGLAFGQIIEVCRRQH